MSPTHCTNCNALLHQDALCCPQCWQPIECVISAELYEQCLYKATGREWIAVAKNEQQEFVFMERFPVARMEFTYMPPTERGGSDKYRNWKYSAVRSYLNGPYLVSLPKWVINRLVPIEAIDMDYHVVDKVSIFSSQEIHLFLEKAPKNQRIQNYLSADNAFLQSRTLKNDYGEPAEEDQSFQFDEYYDEDPLSQWKNDHRQYSKELYDEWYDEHDKAIEEHNIWLSNKEAQWDREYNERMRQQSEREDAIWNFSMLDYCDETWTRDGHSFGRSNYLLTDWRNAKVIPVICLNTSDLHQTKAKPIVLSDAQRILQKYDDEQFHEISEVKASEEAAICQFVFGESAFKRFGFYDGRFLL